MINLKCVFFISSFNCGIIRFVAMVYFISVKYVDGIVVNLTFKTGVYIIQIIVA